MPRMIELILAIIGLIALSPFLLIIVLIVRATSPGPAFFKQIRVGKNQKSFTILKIRTMRLGTKQIGTHLIEAEAVTTIGRFFRKLRIDEVPQLLNVIMGHMSIVGPRPCLPSQTDVIAARLIENVYSVRPGITGLAQIKGLDMATPTELAEIDGYYVRSRSFGLDLLIILKTVTGQAMDNRSNIIFK